jgi:TolA-binding protein
MRHLYVIFLLLLFISSSCSQLNSEMNSKIRELSSRVDSLSEKVAELTTLTELQDEELLWLQNELAELKKTKEEKTATPSATPLAAPLSKTAAKETVDTQCQAITNSGKRCSRTALKGSDYCWQHKATYEPEIPAKK